MKKATRILLGLSFLALASTSFAEMEWAQAPGAPPGANLSAWSSILHPLRPRQSLAPAPSARVLVRPKGLSSQPARLPKNAEAGLSLGSWERRFLRTFENSI